MSSAALAAPKRGLSQDPPERFVLMPGDVIDVTTVSTETEEHTELIVDAAGFVRLPLVGEVKVGALGLGPAAALIQEQLRRFDKLATVQIKLNEAKGQRVTSLGAVAQPGAVSLIPGMRLADVIALSGGPAVRTDAEGQAWPLADLANASVYRQGYRLPVDVNKALRGHKSHNVLMRAGDSVFVPPLRLLDVSVLGAVGGATAVPYRPGLRLTQALAMAGGPTIDADLGDLRLLRREAEGTRVYHARLDSIVSGQASDIAMQPGDVLYVTDHPIADFGEVLDRLGPLMSMSVSALFLALAIAAN